MSSTWNEPSWPWLTAVLILAGGAFDDGFQAQVAAHLPDRFERYLASVVQPTAAERKRLLHGAPVTKLLDADPSKEVAVFGAVWIDAPAEADVAAVKDIENFERGGAFVC